MSPERGDRVTLVRPAGGCRPGDEGVVRHVDSQGNLTVEITHRNPDCTPYTELLPPLPPDYFRGGGHCGP